MKQTNTTVTSTTTAEATSNNIADTIYPDISERSPRQIEAKLVSLRGALEDSVRWNNFSSMTYFMKEIGEWTNLKIRIEERARAEGRT